jgi:hypothetical protein
VKKIRGKPKPYGGTRPVIMNASASPVGQAFAIRNCDATGTAGESQILAVLARAGAPHAGPRIAELDIAPHIIESVLNHISGHSAGVAGIYNRSTLEPQERHALTVWGEHLLAIVEGRSMPDRVVALRA